MKHIVISWLKNGYSFFVRLINKMTQTNKINKQVCYLMSFPNNNKGLIEDLAKEVSVIVLYKKVCEKEAKELAENGISIVDLDSVVGLVKSIKIMGQSKVIIADNYFAILGDIAFSHQQTVYQIWHATGAIKQFGLEDKSVTHRSKSDINRFKRVYDSFDYVFVASKKMGDVFKRSYGLSDEQIHYTGFPRTDNLLQSAHRQDKDYRRILYLPTYREGVPIDSWLLNLDKLSNKLQTKDVLQVKLHPHIDMSKTSTKNIEWIASNQSADDYIKQADCLITDYSSVAFDFTLANPDKTLIMYWPDEEEYRKKVGIQPKIENDFPGKVAHTTQEVISQLNDRISRDNNRFNQLWNTYNDGQATQRVIDEIKEVLDGEK
ncbi:CDP-glycerol glycerophosphotransferase family protein [Vagococcus sp. JNUCC 83]